jgi:hypothetical protein
MLYIAMMLFSLIVGISSSWALDKEQAKYLERDMSDLFMLEHGGPDFVMEDGVVIAKLYNYEVSKERGEVHTFLGERVLGTPEKVREFLRGFIKEGMVEFRSHPFPGAGNPKEALFNGALGLVGDEVLKDPTMEPILLQILLDPQFDELYRDSAMISLAELNFDKYFSTFMKFIDPDSTDEGGLAHTAEHVIHRWASATQLDKLEAVIAKDPNEHWRRYVTTRIAERRAELKKGP